MSTWIADRVKHPNPQRGCSEQTLYAPPMATTVVVTDDYGNGEVDVELRVEGVSIASYWFRSYNGTGHFGGRSGLKIPFDRLPLWAQRGFATVEWLSYYR